MNNKIKTILITIISSLTIGAGITLANMKGADIKVEENKEQTIIEGSKSESLANNSSVSENNSTEEVAIESNTTIEENPVTENTSEIVETQPNNTQESAIDNEATEEPIVENNSGIIPKKQYTQDYGDYEVVYSVLDQGGVAITVVGGFRNKSTQTLDGFNIRYDFYKNGSVIRSITESYKSKVEPQAFSGDPFLYVGDLNINDFDSIKMIKQ